MRPSLKQIREIIEVVLQDHSLARLRIRRRYKESEIYTALIMFSQELGLSSDDWFALLSIFRSRVLRDDLKIMARLSEGQKERLPPPQF